jgi:GTPase
MFRRVNKRTRVVAAIFNHQRRKFVEAKIKGNESKQQVKYANNRRKFVDRVRVSLIGGNGGLGCISHKHLGPGKKRADGGDAGKGGDVIIRTNSALRSLNITSHHYRAKDGGNGGPSNRTGKNAKNVYVDVPLGTLVKEIHRSYDQYGEITEEKTVEIDMDKSGVEHVAASGGNGGRGNQHLIFSESSGRRYFENKKIQEENDQLIQQQKMEEVIENLENMEDEFFQGDEDNFPSIDEMYVTYNEDGVQVFSPFPVYNNNNEKTDNNTLLKDVLENNEPKPNIGKLGEERFYELELKLIADVGLVGYPNAGKSTLLGMVSKARPKVAAYPFTTLHPFVGMVEFNDGHRFSVADIPGLINGAHKNVGLGHEFLRHIERNRIHAYVIDVSDKFNPPAGIVFQALQQELNLYEAGLGNKDSVIIANKIDAFDDDDLDSLLYQEEQFQSLVNVAGGREIFPISAANGDGINELVLHLKTKLRG